MGIVPLSSSEESIPFNSLFPESTASLGKRTARTHVFCSPSQAAGPSYLPPSLFHCILKVSNISWDISVSDICLLLGPEVQPHQVHIPIDRLTGKTKCDLFVELPDSASVMNALVQHNRKIIKGRSLIMVPSTFEELYRLHFTNGICISAHEASSLLNICRNYKIYFSRKCAERPFEHIISILRLAPWYCLDTDNVSVLYDLCLQSALILKSHIEKAASKPLNALGNELLTRLLQAALQFPSFSDQQSDLLKEFQEQDLAILNSDGDELTCNTQI